MLLKEFLRLPNEKHAIKEASVSLFLGSPFVQIDGLLNTLKQQFAVDFNQIQGIGGFKIKLEGNFAQGSDMSANSEGTGLLGIRAMQVEKGAVTEMLQLQNDVERVVLSFHTLRYNRWADFLAWFQQLAQRMAPLLANMVVVAVSLHYQDELEWTHPTEPLPLAQLYRPNPDYLPNHFFDGAFSELLLTVPSMLDELNFFDRLHITSLANNRPVATISHNMVHQFTEVTDLPSLLAQPNKLQFVLQQAHEHNKTVLRGILQPEIQNLIGLTS